MDGRSGGMAGFWRPLGRGRAHAFSAGHRPRQGLVRSRKLSEPAVPGGLAQLRRQLGTAGLHVMGQLQQLLAREQKPEYPETLFK